jgi:hypothetical protein
VLLAGVRGRLVFALVVSQGVSGEVRFAGPGLRCRLYSRWSFKSVSDEVSCAVGWGALSARVRAESFKRISDER